VRFPRLKSLRSISVGLCCAACVLNAAGSLLAQGRNLAPGPDQFGGVSSSRIIVRLKADAFKRTSAARANAVADDDVLPKLSTRLQTTAAGWRANKMRRLYPQSFGSPASAEKHALDRTFVLEVPPGTNTAAMAAAIVAASSDVEFATTDVIGGVAADQLIPNDTDFGVQWGMHNTGQNINGQIGTPGADIDAPEAWAIHTGDFGTVTVAILDSGVDSHPEYGNNVAPYPNGRIVQGYNTYWNSSDPAKLRDGCPHGTHVAGIIAAQGNNGAGVAGVTWGAYIMPIRVLFDPPNGCYGNSTDLAEGIVWAADHGANIINMSLQYNLTLDAEIAMLQNAVNYAHDRGVLLVGATGNNSSCGFGVVCYPAKALNVLGVGATDNQDNIGSFSNWGPQIDVCAPGKDIWSTWTNGSYTYLYGTSMATPHVAGLAALVKSYVPELTNDQIASIIMSTAKDLGPAGWDDHYGFGRINAHDALKAAEVWPGILSSDPPDGAIDARQPLDATGTIAQGWSEVTITFPRNLGGVASADFAVTQTVAGAAPVILSVQPIDAFRVRVVLDRPIAPLAWTTITHVPTGTRIRLGYLPGDVNGDRTSAPVDILALIDSLNGVGPILPIWSTDIDRSNLAAPADILQEIDLLNGAGPYDAYNGATLPPPLP